MAIDISWLSYGLPLYTLILVFVIAFAILKKTHVLGENNWINVILALVVTFIFISFTSPGEFLANLTLWFTVLLVICFFFLLLIYFVMEKPDAILKPLSWVFVALLILIVIFAIFYTFPQTTAYLPGGNEETGNSILLDAKHFILQDKVLNSLLLVAALIIVGIVITR